MSPSVGVVLALIALASAASAPSPPPGCPEFPVQNTSSPQAIEAQCFFFLDCHALEGVSSWGLPFHYYRPSLEKYGPAQWLWDSSSHQIAWSWRNVTNSMLDMRTMLSMQKADGRIPEMIFWVTDSAESAAMNAFFWSDSESADLTQMPLNPFALRAIFNQSGDVAFVQEALPALVRYYEWWRLTRMPDGDGLVVIIHGWESGLDASPMYDLAYGVAADNPKPSFDQLYPQFEELVLAYKFRDGWNQTRIVGQSTAPPHELLDSFFLVKDVGVNAVYAAGWRLLGELAAAVGNSSLATYCSQQSLASEAAILRSMWDSELGRFVSLYRARDGTQQSASVEAVQSLFPLLLATLPESIADSIVYGQLMNTSKFWLPFPIPSVAADSPSFNPVFGDKSQGGEGDLMWRGPTWAMLNFLVMEGLWTQGRYGAAMDALMDRWIALYEKSGVWEQYNPLTGESYGAVGLGMSTLIVDAMHRLGRL